jgi:hypothetical protein
VIKEGERSFDLEVMRGTSAAGRLLIELPYPFYWEGFEDETFRRRPDFMAVEPVAAPGAEVERSGRAALGSLRWAMFRKAMR